MFYSRYFSLKHHLAIEADYNSTHISAYDAARDLYLLREVGITTRRFINYGFLDLQETNKINEELSNLINPHAGYRGDFIIDNTDSIISNWIYTRHPNLMEYLKSQIFYRPTNISLESAYKELCNIIKRPYPW